jgi:hypothetical protein
MFWFMTGPEEGPTGGCEAAAIDGPKNLWHFESGLREVWETGRDYAVMAAMTTAVADKCGTPVEGDFSLRLTT